MSKCRVSVLGNLGLGLAGEILLLALVVLAVAASGFLSNRRFKKKH